MPSRLLELVLLPVVHSEMLAEVTSIECEAYVSPP